MPLLAIPDSKVHGANMGPIWGQQDPGGPHVGPMNHAIWDGIDLVVQMILCLSSKLIFHNFAFFANTWILWDNFLF